jgi:hypothetical protein
MRSLLLVVLLLGCVDEALGPRVPIRVGGTPDLALVDQMLPDMGEVIDATPPDMQVPSVPSTNRAVWFIQRHDLHADGIRAALEPPQTPAPFDDLPAPVWVEWAGPGSPGSAVIERRLMAGLPTTALYRMADRAGDAAADVSWLAARVLAHSAVLTLDGRPVLAVAPAPDRAGLNALRTRLADLPTDPLLFMEVDVEDRPWPAADGVVAQARYGAGIDGTDQAAARLRAGRAAALATGWQWIARVGPAPNRRLDDPEAPVPPADALVQSLVLGRRGAQAGRPILLVDALGAWRDDRQVDPVDGQTTQAPSRLTADRPHIAYGHRRLQAIDAHLTTVRAQPPERFDAAPTVLRWQGAEPATAIRTADGITCQTTDSAEWLLDGRPFVLPADMALVYARDTTDLWLDLTFADGTRLHEQIPLPEGETVRIDLSAFAGRIVEGVVLEARSDGQISGMRLSR